MVSVRWAVEADALTFAQQPYGDRKVMVRGKLAVLEGNFPRHVDDVISQSQGRTQYPQKLQPIICLGDLSAGEM